ncbi:DIP1984 family protein [Lysinibacillus sp. CTST325]
MINLAEAVKLKSILAKKVQELVGELHRSAFVTVEKGQSPKTSNRSMKVIEAELAQVRLDVRTLDRLVYEANIKNTVDFKGDKLALVEAIEFATQLRADAELCKQFSMHEKESVRMGYGENTMLYEIAMYEPDEYRERAIILEKDAHKLSNLINAKNYSVEINFDDSRYF